jgi:ketosteroid isomerase-like protein
VSQENVETVQRAYAAWNRRDMATALGLCSPDFDWWELEDVPESTVHHGHAAIGARFAELDDMWIGLSSEPREFIELGDFVVVPVRQTARGRASGVAIDEDWVHVFRMQDGKIVELREYRDKPEALKAVGLEE